MQDLGLGKVTYLDTGSFVVNLDGKKTKIIEKINKNTTAEWGYAGGDCIVTLLKAGWGNIHIAGVQSLKVTPATPTEPALVEISFNRILVRLPLLQTNCPNLAGGRFVATTAMGNSIAAMMSAFPQDIKFEATEGSRIIKEIGEPGSDIFFLVEVRRLPDDD